MFLNKLPYFLPRKKPNAFLFLFMVTYMPLLAQDSAKSIFLGGRINYCFSASRTEVAENLCLYYNQTFSYAISYGAVDQYANGSYRVHGDTVALSSKKAKSFIITAADNPAIPKGKIKLLFKDLRRNAAFVTMGAQDDSANPDQYITLLKQSGKYLHSTDGKARFRNNSACAYIVR